MSNQTKISKIVLEIGGKEINLSLDQAKELKRILNDTFPDPVYVPTVIERTRTLPHEWWGLPEVTYGTNAARVDYERDIGTRQCLVN